jgi:hypothetical protein
MIEVKGVPFLSLIILLKQKRYRKEGQGRETACGAKL